MKMSSVIRKDWNGSKKIIDWNIRGVRAEVYVLAQTDEDKEFDKLNKQENK